MPAERIKRRFSLRQRVAWWLIPPLAILLLFNAFWSYQSAMNSANGAYDRSLSASLKSIAENIHATGGRISVDIPYSALDLFEEGVQERIFYAIIGPDGQRLTGYDDLLPPPFALNTNQPVMADASFRGQPIRLAGLSKRLYDPELVGGDSVSVVFAETTEGRTRLALSLFLDSLRPQLLLIAVSLVLVVVVLRTAFRPLFDLRDTITQRKEDDLTPVSADNVPNELLPLVDAINYHMARLGKMLEARRRFLADAAHQIRTPLTVLGTQAEYGQRQTDLAEMRRTFASLVETVRSTRRMANQMLVLARAEPANGLIQEARRIDFSELVCDVAGEFATIALKKNIELACEGATLPHSVNGNVTMLREMVSNLVDNALRYTPENGHVTLELALVEPSLVLRVVDDGVGIPLAERENVFRRFYRVLGQSDADGSGLGLPIVREICSAHGGNIRLGDGAGGCGLVAEVVLPLAAPPSKWPV